MILKSMREATRKELIETLEDLQNQIAELKDKLETANKVIDKMAGEIAYSIRRNETLKQIIDSFYKEIENE